MTRRHEGFVCGPYGCVADADWHRTQDGPRTAQGARWRLDPVVLDFQRAGHLARPVAAPGGSQAERLGRASCGVCGLDVLPLLEVREDRDGWVHL